MSTHFSHDFSRVRVHDDSQAAHSADAVAARAYTVGHHVVFGHGEYAPSTEKGTSLLAHELTHVVQQSHAAQPVLQRAPAEGKTWAGKFMADDYYPQLVQIDGRSTILGYGAHLDMSFQPNAMVDAEKIAFVQSVVSVKNGKVHNKYDDAGDAAKKTSESRMIPAGSPGAGVHVDQKPEISTPLYGMSGSTKEDLAQPIPRTDQMVTTIGWHYKDAGGALKKQDAKLFDEPDLNSGDAYTAASSVMTGEWSQQFETAAVAVAGNQAGTFYGSVQWGWARSPTDSATRLTPFKTKSENVPTPIFLDAVRRWNASKTSDLKTESIDFPLEDLFTVQKDTSLFNDADLTREIATLPKGTPLGRMVLPDPKNRVWLTSVIVTGGKHVGKKGWIRGVDLYTGKKP